MTEAIATGMRHATVSAVDRQSEMAYIDHAKDCEKPMLSAPLERRLLGMDDYLPPHTGAAARSRRQEARHFQTGEFRRVLFRSSQAITLSSLLYWRVIACDSGSGVNKSTCC